MGSTYGRFCIKLPQSRMKGERHMLINMFYKYLRILYSGYPSRAIITEDLPRILPTKFQFIWESGFRGEEYLEINQSETRMTCGGHVCNCLAK
jgi:hypothetical protein